ncbi:MAG: polyprenyl synthetase family protein, partial [Thermoplasmata archaeon]
MTSPSAADPLEPTVERLVAQTLGAEASRELAQLFPVLSQDLADVDWRLHQVLGSRFAQLTEAARYACSTGGKRVRPLLMAAAFRALGAESAQPIASLAAAFQLIHTATLVHDDVIDHADTRRGRPSMPRAYGIPLSIVSGDYLFVRAFELAAEYPKSIILRCGESCADLVEGEVLQESTRFDLSSGREHYFRVVERKTAAIISAALASCAEIGEATPPRIDAMSDYGKALGIAFQIRDDLLDVFGDPDLTGKPLYGDLREGNPTLVALETFTRLEGRRQGEFETLFQLRRKRTKHLLRLRELAELAGAPAAVAAEAEAWADRAVRALEPV